MRTWSAHTRHIPDAAGYKTAKFTKQTIHTFWRPSTLVLRIRKMNWKLDGATKSAWVTETMVKARNQRETQRNSHNNIEKSKAKTAIAACDRKQRPGLGNVCRRTFSESASHAVLKPFLPPQSAKNFVQARINKKSIANDHIIQKQRAERGMAQTIRGSAA